MRRAVARRERAQNAERRCARRSAVRKEDKEQGCDSSADRQVHHERVGSPPTLKHVPSEGDSPVHT